MKESRVTDSPASVEARHSARQRARAEARATFARVGVRTEPQRLFETGGLRWRFPRSSNPCEAAIVNTGGGVAGGDSYSVSLDASAKGPRSRRPRRRRNGSIAATARPRRSRPGLTLAPGARLFWLPQETLMFDGARLERRLEVEAAGEAEFIIAETLVFGRLAMGESRIDASLKDSWRIRRDGRLVFADETRLEHAGAILDRKAVRRGSAGALDDRRFGAQYRGAPARFAGGAGRGRLGRRRRRERLRGSGRRPPHRRLVGTIARSACRVHCRARRPQAAPVALKSRRGICWILLDA